MARGWESKAVEDQIQEAAAAREAAARPQLTAAERERQTRRESLQLSRARIVATIESARDERHRRMLEQTLAHIDAELAECGAE